MGMNMGMSGRIAAVAALLLVMMPVAIHAEDKTVSVGVGFEFTSGDYGTGTRTNSVYVPLTVAVTPTDLWGFSLEIPYVYQSNTNVIAGQFRQMQSQSITMQKITAAMTGSGSGMGSGTIRSSSNSNPSKAQNGIGDITLRTGYVLIQEGDVIPRIRPNLFVKFPTADKNKGLGTGEFDEGIAVEVSKWFGAWYTFLEPGYTIQGKTADIPLKNYLSYSAGAGYQVTDNFRPMLIFKGATAPAEGLSTLLEARLKLKYQATKHTGIEGYFAKGITTSSPDYGAGLAAFYDF
jgi:Putative MetA-pathway of phenol degradation